MANASHKPKTKAHNGGGSRGKARGKKFSARTKTRQSNERKATRRLRSQTQGKAQAQIGTLDPSNSYRASGLMPAG